MSTVLVVGAASRQAQLVTARLAQLPWVERLVAIDVTRAPRSFPALEVHALGPAAPGAADQLAALGEGARAVVALAWGRPSQWRPAMGNLLAAASSIRPEQLVHLSSAAVYGAWPDNPVPLTEAAPVRPNPRSAFAMDMRAAELMAQQWAERSPSTRLALLRAATTLGADRVLPAVLALARRSPVAPGDERLVQFLHAEDLASAVAHVCDRGLQGVFNVAPDEGTAEGTAAALRGRGPLLRAGAARLPSLLTGRDGSWGPGSKPYVEHTWVVSADKLRSTGWVPEYSSEQALVVTDQRQHWDDLPQAKRVALTLGAAGSTLVALGAGGAVWWRHRG